MLILAIAITSCNNGGNKTSESGTEKNEMTKALAKKALNKSIQNVFLGVPFGATYEEACEKLSQDFWFGNMSTKNCLASRSKSGDKISFGGISWDYLYMHFSNNKFYSINLHNCFKTKESAMSNVNGLYSVVSKKYNMKIVQENDTTIYAKAYGITKTNQEVVIACYSYESDEHERWIGVSLRYTDWNFNGISEEL